MGKENEIMERKIKKLSIFDFDGTLVNTELPETGKPRWKEVKGTDWPHQGWWGRAESLDIEAFENAVIDHVVEDYKKEKNGGENLTIMLTGRMSNLSTHVEKILEKHGLEFDRKYYNTGGDTITCKLKTLTKLLIEFPDVELVECWEDRLEHITLFEQWGVEQCKLDKIKEFKINHVIPSAGLRH